MKQIIRLNAVETSSQRSDLGVQISELHLRQVSIGKSDVLAPREDLLVLPLSSDIAIKNKTNRLTSFEHQLLSAFASLVWGDKLNFWDKVVCWVHTGKIAQVSDTQRKEITTWMTKTLEKIKAKARKNLRVLVLRVYLKLLLNLYQKIQVAVNMAKAKTWPDDIWTQERQQSHFRHSFFATCHGNC
ncbi:hypothetical protein WJM97_06695 [Okeanomitos corallinicola TIOX110]|uniref:Uncharacterized protein n=1 Tax=Okeanomitos corallinicola TIOX110 TaxID=3133117 RepID=A0ABZ2UWC1_9CYAN